tara:strand:- start:693 stop:1526 length:834 start_codon:yes stop_codon:yes gene_type:complete
MPLVQLDFPNPLNTSVQIGDFAYFSNPIDYGTTGNPLGGDQWASTTTPHLTSDQGDIIMIGPIQTIIPWDDTVSSIICDMPQALFNQYFSSIIAGGCTPIPGAPPLTNSCAGRTLYPDAAALLHEAFSPGNHNTLYQHIGAIGGGSLCDASLLTNWPYDGGLGGLGPHGASSAAQAITHFQDDHGMTGLSAGMSYSDFNNAVAANGGFGTHSGSIGAPCNCTYPVNCVQGSFIMFSKDNKVNLSSGLGYYASATLRNDSPDKAELFNVGADVFESSK